MTAYINQLQHRSRFIIFVMLRTETCEALYSLVSKFDLYFNENGLSECQQSLDNHLLSHLSENWLE